MSQASRIEKELEALVALVRDGRLGGTGAATRLESFLGDPLIAQPLLEDLPVLLRFSRDLVSECLSDEVPLRINEIGELAWHAARLASENRAVMCALWVGHRLLVLDELEDALRHLDRAAESECTSVMPEIAVAKCLRLVCLERLSRYPEVEACIEETIETAVSQAVSGLCIVVNMVGALTASSTDQHMLAETRIRTAIEEAAKNDTSPLDGPAVLIPRRTMADLYRTYGDIVRRSGDIQRAIEIYQEGRDQGLKMQDSRGAAWCLSEMGITWQRLGESKRADKILAQAADEATAMGDHASALRWRQRQPADPKHLLFLSGFNRLALAMGRLEGHSRPDETAERIARELLAKSDNEKDADLECCARNILTECYRRRGALKQAIASQRGAVARADALGRRQLAIQFRVNLALVMLEAGDVLGANRVAEAAVELGEKLRTDASSEIRQAIGAGLAPSYGVLILVAASEWQSSDGRTAQSADAERVLSLAQKSRTRSLNQWLALTNWRLSDTKKEIGNAVREFIVSETLVEAAADRGASLSGPLERRTRANNQLRSHTHAEPNLEKESAVSLELIRSRLADRSVFLDLCAIETGVVCTWLTRVEPPKTMLVTWTRAQRSAWRDRWHQALRREIRAVMPPGSTKTVWRMAEGIPAATGVAAPPLADCYDELNRKLFEMVLSEVGNEIDHFLIAPQAELFSIPFWALGRFADEARVSLVPSLTSVFLLADRPISQGGFRYKVGDASRTLRLAPRELERLTGFVGLPPHIDSLKEVLQTAKCVHFAGHGHFDPLQPYESGIILEGAASSPLTIRSNFPGCVRVSIPGILAHLDLPECELVVVSACSTGIPREHAASEFTSVPAAFMLAGARNVIAAAWPAHDGATAILMEEFYAALDRTESPAGSLQQARQLLGQIDYQDALSRLGDKSVIPERERPFDAPLFRDAFQHYGIN